MSYFFPHSVAPVPAGHEVPVARGAGVRSAAVSAYSPAPGQTRAAHQQEEQGMIYLGTQILGCFRELQIVD